MTFLQALKNGKRFRRIGESEYFKVAEIRLTGESGRVRMVGEADLDATDWEVEEKRSTINFTDLNRAVANAAQSASMTTAQVNSLKIKLKTELNLDD